MIHLNDSMNRDDAHERLVALLRRAARPPEERVPGARCAGITSA